MNMINQIRVAQSINKDIDIIRRGINIQFNALHDNLALQNTKPFYSKSPASFEPSAPKINIYEGYVVKPAPPQYLKMNGSNTAFYVEGGEVEKYIKVITNGKKDVTLDEDSPYFNQFE